ncbi:Uu.00g063390.m01.CDS01 [Anthostomella pinea]|uniref:Uu.00g063390.m01.CDS01 n=1 Tax=Anthostomella pinea TaxID=933095 RepID=A0AAI8YMW0_9PEZI|nr:Uu.00g063390.m01.CDS01 [Anthostomella pinea]
MLRRRRALLRPANGNKFPGDTACSSSSNPSSVPGASNQPLSNARKRFGPHNLSRSGYDEEKCRNVLVRYCAHIPRNYQYKDGVQQIFLILREHLGDENLDLAGGVLYELIEVDCEHTDDSGAAFQRWRHDHMCRYSDLELPHVPHMMTITSSIIPTERLELWRLEHRDRYPFVLSDFSPSSQRQSHDPSCIRNRKAWLIDHTFYVSTRSDGTRPMHSPNPKEFHEMQWNSDYGGKGKLVEERDIPVSSLDRLYGQSPPGTADTPLTMSSRPKRLRHSLSSLSIIGKIVDKFGTQKKEPERDQRRRSWMPSSLAFETGSLFRDKRASAVTLSAPLPDGCQIPNAIFARKFLLVDTGETLPHYLPISQMPTAESKATDTIVEAVTSGLLDKAPPWSFRGPFTPQLNFDGGLDYQWGLREPTITVRRFDLDYPLPDVLDIDCDRQFKRAELQRTESYTSFRQSPFKRRGRVFGYNMEAESKRERPDGTLPEARYTDPAESGSLNQDTEPRRLPISPPYTPKAPPRPAPTMMSFSSSASRRRTSHRRNPLLFENIEFAMASEPPALSTPTANRVKVSISMDATSQEKGKAIEGPSANELLVLPGDSMSQGHGNALALYQQCDMTYASALLDKLQKRKDFCFRGIMPPVGGAITRDALNTIVARDLNECPKGHIMNLTFLGSEGRIEKLQNPCDPGYRAAVVEAAMAAGYAAYASCSGEAAAATSVRSVLEDIPEDAIDEAVVLSNRRVHLWLLFIPDGPLSDPNAQLSEDDADQVLPSNQATEDSEHSTPAMPPRNPLRLARPEPPTLVHPAVQLATSEENPSSPTFDSMDKAAQWALATDTEDPNYPGALVNLYPGGRPVAPPPSSSSSSNAPQPRSIRVVRSRPILPPRGLKAIASPTDSLTISEANRFQSATMFTDEQRRHATPEQEVVRSRAASIAEESSLHSGRYSNKSPSPPPGEPHSHRKQLSGGSARGQPRTRKGSNASPYTTEQKIGGRSSEDRGRPLHRKYDFVMTDDEAPLSPVQESIQGDVPRQSSATTWTDIIHHANRKSSGDVPEVPPIPSQFNGKQPDNNNVLKMPPIPDRKDKRRPHPLDFSQAPKIAQSASRERNVQIVSSPLTHHSEHLQVDGEVSPSVYDDDTPYPDSLPAISPLHIPRKSEMRNMNILKEYSDWKASPGLLDNANRDIRPGSAQDVRSPPTQGIPKSATTNNLRFEDVYESEPWTPLTPFLMGAKMSKRLFGDHGWLEDTAAQDVKKPTKPESQKASAIFTSLKKKARELVIEGGTALKQGRINHDNKKLYDPTRLRISLEAREQSLVYCELEFNLSNALDAYIKAQLNGGRLQADKLKRVADAWASKGRPRVIGFRYDLETQVDLIAAHIHDFRFYGVLQTNQGVVTGLLHAMKMNARAMRVRTFCQPDSVVAKHILDAQAFLKLLGSPDSCQRAIAEITQFFKVVIERQKSQLKTAEEEHDAAQRRLEGVGEAPGMGGLTDGGEQRQFSGPVLAPKVYDPARDEKTTSTKTLVDMVESVYRPSRDGSAYSDRN